MGARTNASANHIGRRVHLRIAGMSCSDCVHRVRSALKAIAGVRVLEVLPGSATVELHPRLNVRIVSIALTCAGYELIGWWGEQEGGTTAFQLGRGSAPRHPLPDA